MKVNEIFYSIDGEGKRAGQLAAFIRLTGCNLRCSYCDTAYAFSDGQEMSAEEIVDAVKNYHRITLTGGEPLLQNCHEILKMMDGHEVNIETNGSVDLSVYLKYGNVFFTMDFKCPSSKMSRQMKIDNLKILRKCDVLKFVVGNENDLNFAKAICEKYQPQAEIYVLPVFGKIKPSAIVNFMKAEHLENWHLQLQLHKIIWNPAERGV